MSHAPWTVTDCEIDLRPGGIFRTVMREPDGAELPHVGCYLEAVPTSRLVWTDALLAGYRPSPTPFLTFKPHVGGTRYHALVRHRDAAERERREGMGF